MFVFCCEGAPCSRYKIGRYPPFIFVSHAGPGVPERAQGRTGEVRHDVQIVGLWGREQQEQ